MGLVEADHQRVGTASAIEQDAVRKRPFGNELAALVKQGAESVGFENLGGREVEVFRVTDERGRRQVWVTTGEGTQIGSMSVVPKHAVLDGHRTYAGIPVRPIDDRQEGQGP